MNVRPAGLDSAVPANQTSAADAPPAAAETKPTGLAQGPRDGVEAKQAPDQPGVFGDQRKAEAEAKTVTDTVGLAEVLRERASGGLAGDPNFQSLPPALQDRMQALAKKGPPGLAEIFKRLANSPNFRKLSPEVQAKVVELLAKVAGEKGDAQLVEKLVRSGGFGALSEKEQLKMLEGLANKETRESLQGGETQGNQRGLSLGGSSDEVSTLIQLATMLESPEIMRGEDVGALATDADRSGAGGVDLSAPSAYLDVKRIIGQLRAAPELSQASVQRILGAALAPAASTEGWISFEGVAAKGPFHKIELRQSTTLPWRLVNLEVRPNVNLAYQEFRNDLIPASVGPEVNPAGPPDGETSFRVVDAEPKQQMHFGFGAKLSRLRSASIQRDFE